MDARSLRYFVLAALTQTVACGGNVAVGRAGDGGGGAGPAAPPELCPAGVQEECEYPGHAGTLGVGVCQAGARTCDATGLGWSKCTGQRTPGAEVCSTPDDETCDGEGACTGKLLFAHGGAAEGGSRGGMDIAADPWGNVLVTGRFDGSLGTGGLSLHSEGFDAHVLKLDPHGKGLWARQAHGDAEGRAITSDPAGNVLFAAGFQGSVDLGAGPLTSGGASDVLIAKLSPSGEPLWNVRFGGPGSQWPEEMATDAEGNTVVIGGFHGGADLGDGYASGSGETDIFVVKLDPAGQPLWSRRFGVKKSDHGLGIAVDPGGAVLLTGSFEATIDFGGGPLESAGTGDVFLVKLSPGGEHVWSRRFGGDSQDLGEGVAADGAGNIVVAGLLSTKADLGGGALVSPGPYSAFLARYSPAGEHLASQAFGGPDATAYAVDVAVDSAGNAVIFGHLTGTASFGGAPLTAAGDGWKEDVFVAKYEPSGHHAYSFAFGDSARQRAYGLAVDPLGSALLTGDFQGTIDFGAGPLSAPPPDGWDLYITKLAP